MKTYAKLKFVIAALVFGFGINFYTHAQTYKLNNKVSSLIVDGTSNIHDWDLKAENCGGILTTEMDEGSLEEIKNLEFSVRAESLNSGKSAMDKNTYKALKTDKYDKINFQLEKVNSLEKASANTYQAKTTGTLEIAGVKKKINLNFDISLKSSEIILKGEHSINMTDYGVEPPTAMFGTITTGETVKIKFESHFNK